MGYKTMLVVSVRNAGARAFAFEYSYELDAIGNGDWILIPDDIQNVAVVFTNTDGASGKIQATLDPIEVVKSGSGITPVDWDLGDVTDTAQDVAVPVTAIRLVQNDLGSGSGKTKISVRAQ